MRVDWQGVVQCPYNGKENRLKRQGDYSAFVREFSIWFSPTLKLSRRAS